MIGPKEKKERALGVRLGLKGERCSSPKCAMVRKPYRPGVHGQSRRRRQDSEFNQQLKEKQKFKLTYGLDDRNLKQIFLKALKARGADTMKIVEFLERRLDNVIYRLGFAPSRGAARQIVVHGHIMVNGRRVWSPGFQVRPGDMINLKSGSETKTALVKRKEILKKYEAPSWLELNKDKLEGKVKELPQNIDIPFEVSLLVEYFSK